MTIKISYRVGRSKFYLSVVFLYFSMFFIQKLLVDYSPFLINVFIGFVLFFLIAGRLVDCGKAMLFLVVPALYVVLVFIEFLISAEIFFYGFYLEYLFFFHIFNKWSSDTVFID